MPDPAAQPTPDTPSPAHLGRRTVSGFGWLSAQTLASKAVSTLAQIALARLLVPDDFGLFALALTVVQFAQLLHGYGLREVLIRLHDEMDTWVTPAFWMTVAGGLLAGALVFAAAGPAALAYAEPALEDILRFVAIAMPFTAMTTVSIARLEASMRYRSLAIANLVVTAAQFSTAIALAFLGLGVWSLVIPLVAARVVTFVTLTILAHPPIRMRPEFASWGRIFRDVGMLTLAGLLTVATLQGDYLVLGLFVTSAQVGLYYIAYQLSRQPLVLIATNFSRVLLPAFGRLKDNPQRQLSAFVEATSVLSLVFVPICVIAAALADPVIILAFGHDYAGSVPLFAILSLGAMFRGGVESGGAMLRAQGRFRTILYLRLVLTPFFFLMLTAGIVIGGVVGGAVGVGLYTIVMGLVQPAVAMRPVGGGLKDSVMLVLGPFVAALVAGAAAYSVGLLTPVTIPGRVAHLLCGGLAAVVIYALLARLFMPDRWNVATSRAQPILEKLRRGVRTASPFHA